VIAFARQVALGVISLLTVYGVTTVADSIVSETGVAECIACWLGREVSEAIPIFQKCGCCRNLKPTLADISAFLNSHTLGWGLGAHNESIVGVGVAAIASERRVLVSTRRVFIVGCLRKGNERESRGNGHNGPLDGHD
jgi:hypothetical protein